MSTQANGSNGNGHHVDASVSAESEGGASLFHVAPPPGELTKKDFVSNQEVRWCPGCGDYAILNNVQKVMPELGNPREKMVFVSGIGCSSRFPYYMNTYGFHSIHGRAPAIATGIKSANPELSVWVITGDGDALSIGGNHFMHVLRRNLDINYILFNNRIYGLTKAQYSPTSVFAERSVRPDKVLYLEDGKPMIFGKDRKQGIRMNGAHPEVVTIGENGVTEADILVHDIHLQDPSVAFMLARMEQPDFPQPVGVFRAVERPSYDQMLVDQIDTAIAKSGPGSLEKLIYSGDMWTVE